MQTKQLLFTTVFTSLLVAAVCAQAQTANTSQAETTSRRIQKAAPVIQRRASLPAGWFNQGQAPAALTDTTASGARPVAHFDTTGKSDEKSMGVSNRLRQIRRSVVFDELKPVEQVERKSSRRATESGRAEPVAANRDDSQGVTSSPKSSATVTATAGPEAAVQQTTPGQPSARRNTVAMEDTAALTPNEGEAEPPQPALATDDVTDLPSVMKRPTAGEELPPTASDRVTNQQQMSLKPIESGDNSSVVTADAEGQTTTRAPEQDLVQRSTQSTSGDRVLITNKSPVLSVTTRGPRTIVVGKEAAFEFDLRNSSQVAAKEVLVRMNVPHWVEVAQQDASIGSTRIEPDEQGDSTLTWSIGHLNGGAEEKLKLTIIPRGSRPLDLGLTWSFLPAQSTAQIQVQEPKLDISVIGPQDVLFGETKIYTLTVSNPGTGDAENVVLNLMPLVPNEKTAGIRQIGTVRAGTRRSIEVELTARQTGRLQVRAEATADGGLRAQGVQDVLVRRAALEVQVVGPPMKYAGTHARYAIRVTNSGDATARDVVAIANLPAGAKSVASSAGGSLDANHGQIQWQIGSIRPNATRVLELECVLIAPGSNRLDLRAVAEGDVTALGSAVTTVESLADLKMTVDDPKGAVAVGADVMYEIRIKNRGTKAAADIQLYGFFSEGIEPASIRGWRGSVTEGEVVIERIPRLGAGQEMVIKITAQAHRSGDHVFRAELECNDPETKLAVEEWTRFFGEADPIRQADQSSPATPNR